MIRLFLFSRRLPSLTREEFHRQLLHSHAPLVRGCAGFMKYCGGYMQNHFNGQISRSGDDQVLVQPQYDNCSEFWYENIDHILNSYNNDDYFKMLRPDENSRTDATTRIALLAQETVVFEDEAFERTPSRSKLLVLGGRPEVPAGIAAPDAAGVTELRVRCLRKTVNTVIGVMDFQRARISEAVVPEFGSITTFCVADRAADGAMPAGGNSFRVFDPHVGASQIALWARSHVIVGEAA